MVWTSASTGKRQYRGFQPPRASMDFSLHRQVSFSPHKANGVVDFSLHGQKRVSQISASTRQKSTLEYGTSASHGRWQSNPNRRDERSPRWQDV